jgi:metallophosphoesterase (TIGR00282 family)
VNGIPFIGDVVGSAGRRALFTLLPQLVEEFDPLFTVVNGENAAAGKGITAKIGEEFFAAGVDAITLGNHAYKRKEGWALLDDDRRVVRPANDLMTHPGRGSTVIEKNGVRLGLLNISGNHGMNAPHPFIQTTESTLSDLAPRSDLILVDMHAEATSEKVALGWILDGRVTAVVGTHTHVPTSDARVLPHGTAYITDVGMTGSRDGVIGVIREQAIEGMRTRLPVRFAPAEADPWLNGVMIQVDDSGKATQITQVLRPA